mgnify:CR=1 FL=1
MFDTVRIGKKIAELRKQKNLTQSELADAMEVSYQAVSNWERGNSMPDISKLADLTEILGTSVDELLGKKNSVVERLAGNEKIDPAEVDRAELTEAAEIAKPSVVEELAEKLDPKDIAALLPFLGEKAVARLALREYEKGNDIAVFLPFLDEDGAGTLLMRAVEDGRGDVRKFLPFASEERLGEAALAYKRQGKNTEAFLPFLGDDAVKALASEALETGGLKALLPYLPFLSERDAEQLAEQLTHRREE